MYKKKIIATVIILAVLWLVGGCATGGQSGKEEKAKEPKASEQKTPPSHGQEPDTRKLVAVEIKDFTFQPGEIKVKPRDIIDWENKDSAEHSVHSDDDSWQSRPLAQGEHYEKSFDEPGTYTYHCHVHPTMKATIVVE